MGGKMRFQAAARLLAVVLLLPLLISFRAAAEEPPISPQQLVRESLLVPIQIDGAEVSLDAFILRPKGDGPFPLAVLTVGQITMKDRSALSPIYFHYQAAEFARRGWATVFFLRRGYGKSGGQADGWSDSCSAENVAAIAKNIAAEYEAVFRHFAAQPFVDRTRLLAVGQGTAGAGVAALAGSPPEGLRGVVNFGATGGSCPDAALLPSIEAAGRAAKVPALCVYAENDVSMPPNRVKLFFDAYRQAGGKGDLVVTAPFEKEGAALFFWRQGIAFWRAPTDAFLRDLSLPTWNQPPEAAVMIPLPDIVVTRNRTTFWLDGVNAAWAQYVQGPPSKAFVFGTGFASAYSYIVGQSTTEEAQKLALQKCESAAVSCRILAVDDEVVGK